MYIERNILCHDEAQFEAVKIHSKIWNAKTWVTWAILPLADLTCVMLLPTKYLDSLNVEFWITRINLTDSLLKKSILYYCFYKMIQQQGMEERLKEKISLILLSNFPFNL